MSKNTKHRIFFTVAGKSYNAIKRAAVKANYEEPNSIGKFAKEAAGQRAAKILKPNES